MLVTPAAGQPSRRAQAWLTYNVRQKMSVSRKLVHEIWEDLDESGQWLPCICIAGKRGADARAMLSKKARRIGTVEASSHFEAMTAYHLFLGREPYTSLHESDYREYPKEWFIEQVSPNQ